MAKKIMPRLLIAASGTGGHIFPALSVAESLPDHWEISWLGVPHRLENDVIPKKYPLIKIPVTGLQEQGIKKLLKIFQLLWSTIDVFKIIIRRDIQIVFTTGGYIAVPVILASKLSGIRVVLHDSNALPGKATRFLGRLCDVVALGVPSAIKQLKGCKTIVTGTPVRDSFLSENPLPGWVPKGLEPLIVVMGGSQGAVGLNLMTRKIFPWLLNYGCRVVHIIGTNDQYSKIDHVNFVERPFVQEMAGLLQHADLVVSRAGAGCLSELAVCNTPAIFVPFPHAADDHQEMNAAYAAQFGAALIVHQSNVGTEHLKRVLVPLLENYFPSNGTGQEKCLLDKMSKGMEKIAVRDAHLRLVDILTNFVE